MIRVNATVLPSISTPPATRRSVCRVKPLASTLALPQQTDLARHAYCQDVTPLSLSGGQTVMARQIQRGRLGGWLLWLALWTIVLIPMDTAIADDFIQRRLTDDEKNGEVTVDIADGTEVEFTWTNDHGNLLDFLNRVKVTAKDGKASSGQVPQKAGGEFVCDVRIDAPGISLGADPQSAAFASLHIEALGHSGPILTVTRFTTAAWEIVGYDVPISIPGIYGDTNGDSLLGSGDLLYSSADLYAFTSAGMPAFNLGDSVSIVNGVSADFPGMHFGSQPITLDASQPSGFYNPAPVTLTGTIQTRNHVTATSAPAAPEPATLALAAVGFLAGFARRIRRLTDHP
jgi:hypothetical protein